MKPERQRVRAYLTAGVIDALGVRARPGAVIVSNGHIVEAGHPEEIKTPLDTAEVIERPDHLIIPMMVNAHAHLDLTNLGTRPYDGDFTGWLLAVASGRPTDELELREAIIRGASLCREAGVEYVGDVARHPDAVEARRHARLPGVSYLEVIGLGPRQTQRIEELDAWLEQVPYETSCAGHTRGVILGITPHAPYTTGPELYDHACELSKNHAYRLSSHVAETPEELRFLREGGGATAEHMRHFGYCDRDIESLVCGQHSIDRLGPEIRRARWLLAHCNYVEDEHLDLLARTGTSVAYCPVASDYFGHRGHRYREMLEAGVNVCLGTDSILCQRADDPQPMSILSQMRHLFRRDGTDARTLLTMATTNGMLALELREADAAFERGSPGLFAAVRIDPNDSTDLLIQALSNDHVVEPIRDAVFGIGD